MSSYIFFRIEARRKILDPIRCYIHSYTLCCCFLFERIRDFDLLRRFFILDFVINREMSNCCIITEVSIIYQFFSLSCLGCSIWAICIQRTTMVFQGMEKSTLLNVFVAYYDFQHFHRRNVTKSTRAYMQNVNKINNVWCLNMSEEKMNLTPEIGFTLKCCKGSMPNGRLGVDFWE